MPHQVMDFTDTAELQRLRECCAWARTFLREAGRELTGSKNDYRLAAIQLKAVLNGLARK